MVDPGVYFGIKASLDSLTSSFEKLENLHYGMFKQDIPETRLHKRNNSSSALLKSNIRVQPLLEKQISILENLKKEHSSGIKNLKNLLLGSHPEVEKFSKNNSLEACKKTLGGSLDNLKEKLLRDFDMEYQRIIDPYFYTISSDVDKIFVQIQKICGISLHEKFRRNNKL